MKLSILDDLDILQYESAKQRSQWIHQQQDQDLYQVGTWLLMNLSAHSQNLDHRRTNTRDILTTYYYTKSWTPKQKHLLGHSIIEHWEFRETSNDPRYYM
jgi:hypothetical protein